MYLLLFIGPLAEGCLHLQTKKMLLKFEKYVLSYFQCSCFCTFWKFYRKDHKNNFLKKLREFNSFMFSIVVKNFNFKSSSPSDQMPRKMIKVKNEWLNLNYLKNEKINQEEQTMSNFDYCTCFIVKGLEWLQIYNRKILKYKLVWRLAVSVSLCGLFYNFSFLFTFQKVEWAKWQQNGQWSNRNGCGGLKGQSLSMNHTQRGSVDQRRPNFKVCDSLRLYVSSDESYFCKIRISVTLFLKVGKLIDILQFCNICT